MKHERGRQHVPLRGLPGERRQLGRRRFITATTSEVSPQAGAARSRQPDGHAGAWSRGGRLCARMRDGRAELCGGHRSARASPEELFRAWSGNAGKPFTSKALKDCYYQGAERFGWSKRKSEPRSMREGRELIGYGMATGIWEALRVPTSAEVELAPGRARLDRQHGRGRYRHRHLYHPRRRSPAETLGAAARQGRDQDRQFRPAGTVPSKADHGRRRRRAPRSCRPAKASAQELLKRRAKGSRPRR